MKGDPVDETDRLLLSAAEYINFPSGILILKGGLVKIISWNVNLRSLRGYMVRMLRYCRRRRNRQVFQVMRLTHALGDAGKEGETSLAHSGCQTLR